jgi:peptidoglycan/LPS O-acetylase OafA/YrhL
MQSKQNARFATIDGMRGIAAIFVVLYHGTGVTLIEVPRGYLAVDLFFVLSGFILNDIYAPRFESGMGFRQFMTIRAKRLYPLYFLGLLLGLVARSQQHFGTALRSVPMGLLGLPTPAPAYVPLYDLNPPCWSLFAEWLINIAFVLWLWRMPNRGLMAVMALAAGAVAWAFYLEGNISASWLIGNAWVGWARVTFSFPMGMLLNRLYHRHELDRFRDASPWIGFGALMAMAALFLSLNDLFVVFVAFPLVVLAGAMFEPKASAFWMRLGSMSYPLYCIHFPILMVVRFIAIRTSHPQIVGTIGMAGIIVAALMVDKVFEPQFRRWIARPAAA